jgi:DNA-binding transcriptional LysR family regulator
LVRIAASRQVARQILPGMVVRIQESAPGIDIGIVASDEVSNLLRRDADIAIRNVRPQQSSLVIKKVGEMRVQAYASRGYLRRHGMPETMQDLLKHPLVGADRDPEFARAIEHSANTSGVDTATVRVAVRSDDYSTQFAAVRAGLGIGFSLSGLINRHDDLQVVEIGTSLPHVPFWLAVHREIRTAPAIRTVFDLLSELLKAELR